MYHIAVLTSSETQEAFYIEQLSRFCFERGLFPKMDCDRTSGGSRVECGGASADAFSRNAHHLVQRSGFFPACVSAACRLFSVRANNRRSVSARTFYMVRWEKNVCLIPDGSQQT